MATNNVTKKNSSCGLFKHKKNFHITDYSGQLYEKGIVSNGDCVAFAIDDFLSKKECKELIQLTEQKGYEPALVNVGFGCQKFLPEVRRSDRCIIDDENLAERFWQHVKCCIDPIFQKHAVIGLNERMRFLRYDKGHYFAPHYDGSYVRPDGKELSLMTFFLYLNDGFKGGASTFIHPKNASVNIPCVPKRGRLLVFEHHIFHEGSILKNGRKYALRTDFMYSKIK